MKRRWLAGALTSVLLFGGWITAALHGQGPFPAQIQAAIQALLQSNAIVSGNWTCTGTCTGFGGTASSITGSIASPQIAVASGPNVISGSSDLTWSTSTFLARTTTTSITLGANTFLLDAGAAGGLEFVGNKVTLIQANSEQLVMTDGFFGFNLRSSAGDTANLQYLIGGAHLAFLIPGSGETIDLGTSALPFRNIFLNGSVGTGATSGHAITFRARDVDAGTDSIFATLTAANAPTFAIAPPFGGTVSVDTTTLTKGTVNVPTISETATLTNKRITPRIVTPSDATSITPDSDSADMTYQANTQGTGTLTINADGGAPTNGQRWILKIKSTNVQTFSWSSSANGYLGGTTALPTTTTGGTKVDYFAFLFDSISGKWHYVGTSAGF